MAEHEGGTGTHEEGRCPLCAGILAAARAARSAVRGSGNQDRRGSSAARRIWAAARQGRLELVPSSPGAGGRREREV
jgi:hypothetical protein